MYIYAKLKRSVYIQFCMLFKQYKTSHGQNVVGQISCESVYVHTYIHLHLYVVCMHVFMSTSS